MRVIEKGTVGKRGDEAQSAATAGGGEHVDPEGPAYQGGPRPAQRAVPD